jgi:hypothetical protein
MTQLILHENDIGGVAICTPTPEALETYTVLEIALKDTPTGKPFWIVDKVEVSNDHTFFNAWELDVEALGEPTGYGIDYEDWEKEYKK